MKKERILIVGAQGTGKTALAQNLSRVYNLPVFDEMPSIEAIVERNDNGIYASNAISLKEALKIPHIDFVVCCLTKDDSKSDKSIKK